MRSEKEMMALLLDFARADERIRIVTLEGSRTNSSAKKDKYQDYDISYLVRNYHSFLDSDDWLAEFGERVIMQKPESMSLFPPTSPWMSYLMIFTDGNKLDLSIIPLEKLEDYLQSDGLIEVLLDKDKLIKEPPQPTDAQFWITKPTVNYFDDCCNEFWWVLTYAVKGLLRDEILFASGHIEQILRPQLFNMLAWKIGADYGYDKFSLGKQYKEIKNYLKDQEWQLLMQTYRLDSIDNCWLALAAITELFRQTSTHLARLLNYPYPNYDVKVSEFIRKQKEEKQNENT